MISAGLATKQRNEHKTRDGTRPLNGAPHISDSIRLIVARAFSADLKPSENLGTRPELIWLPKNSLHVDIRYQRDAVTKRSLRLIRRFIEGFAWSKFQPITVAKISDGARAGHYSVIDGQHRAIAAVVHPLVVDVPCWVINASDVGTQANAFVSINRDRSNIQPLQLYRAQLAAGDRDAARIDRICREAGIVFAFHISGGTTDRLPPRHTQAVATIGRLLARHGDRPVTGALKTLVAAFPDTPGQLRGQLIEAVTVLLAKHGDRINPEHLVRTLAERDCEEFVDAARDYRKLMKGSTRAAMIVALEKIYDTTRPAGSGLKRLERIRRK